VRESVSRVIRVVWSISLVWLAIGFIGEMWWFVKYLSDPDNPARYEYAIGAGIFFICSWPAAVGVLVAALVPRTGVSTPKRLIGVALLLCWIIIVFLFESTENRIKLL